MRLALRTALLRSTSLLSGALVLMFLAGSAAAETTYVTAWQARYPSSTSDNNVQAGTGTYCQLCHWNPSGGASWNAYGWQIRQYIQAGQSIAAALASAEGANSDNDPTGATNLAEITANTQPGWTPGANNTRYQNSNQTPNQTPPAGIQGSLDPAVTSFAFCPGDGTGTACPCANSSAVGANVGCLNSLGTGGGLVATGNPSLAADTLVLAGSGMPNSSALYFQGTSQQTGGAGAVFGDGLRCAAGSVIRLGTKVNAAGASQYPAAGDQPISIRGANVAGGIRTYQIWYRNAAAFCSASTFNLTNGWQLTWAP